MTDHWIILSPIWNLVLSLGCILILTIFLVWLEWKRQTPFFTIRIVSVIVLMAGLSGVLLRPAYRSEKSDTVILLTSGYSPALVDSLLKVYPGSILLHGPEAKSFRQSKHVASWHQLTISFPAITFVVGEGLPVSVLESMPNESFQFLPSPLPAGVTYIQVNEPVFPNRVNTIEGMFYVSGSHAKLYLDGPGDKEDSITFDRPGEQKFTLNFIPKEPGKFLYTLHSDQGFQESLPVHVQDHPVSNILFIQNYPTFESLYLKNFLAKQHRLLFRYQLSRNTFRYEYINRKQQALLKLDAASLSTFDLLIIDSDALQALPKSESLALQQSIHSGLGVVILFNEDPAGIKRLRDFLPVTFNKISTDTAHFDIGQSRSVTLPAWPVAPTGNAPVVAIRKNKNRILSGYQSMGLGKTGFQLLQETYRLTLQGDSAAYNSLWSDVLEETARGNTDHFTMKITTPQPWFPDQALAIEVISSGPEPEVFQNKTHVPLIEDLLINDVWRAKVWESEPGWHALTVKNDSARLNYYISTKNTWPSLKTANVIRQTLLHANHTGVKTSMREFYQPVALWIFYAMFLIGAGILWISPKVR
jgi:hypothetical protein